MKTRENELHEPFVKVKTENLMGWKDYYVECSVCKKPLKCSVRVSPKYNEEKHKEELLRKTLEEITYCPNCGARLKEIEK